MSAFTTLLEYLYSPAVIERSCCFHGSSWSISLKPPNKKRELGKTSTQLNRFFIYLNFGCTYGTLKGSEPKRSVLFLHSVRSGRLFLTGRLRFSVESPHYRSEPKRYLTSLRRRTLMHDRNLKFGQAVSVLKSIFLRIE